MTVEADGPLPSLARLLGLHAAQIVSVLAPRLTDTDKECRAALRSLLRDRILQGLPGPALAPFLPALSLHTASAMTHLDESVRRDALAVRLVPTAPTLLCSERWACQAIKLEKPNRSTIVFSAARNLNDVSCDRRMSDQD